MTTFIMIAAFLSFELLHINQDVVSDHIITKSIAIAPMPWFFSLSAGCTAQQHSKMFTMCNTS